jgi:hypothetical protein
MTLFDPDAERACSPAQLSRRSAWKHTAIFVIEDDAPDGPE